MGRRWGHSLAILLALLACGAFMVNHMAAGQSVEEEATAAFFADDEAAGQPYEAEQQMYEDALREQEGFPEGLEEGLEGEGGFVDRGLAYEYEAQVAAAEAADAVGEAPPYYSPEDAIYTDHRNNGSQIVSLLDSNYCWEVPHPSANSEAAHLFTCHSYHEQWWAYTHERTLVNTRTGGVLDAGDGTPGVPVAHRPFDAEARGQRWTWHEAGDLRPDVNSDVCLSVHGGVVYPGALLEVATCSGWEGQRWSPGDCMDTEPMCQHWTSMGECHMNREFMVGTFMEDGSFVAGHCRASCGACVYHMPGAGDEASPHPDVHGSEHAAAEEAAQWASGEATASAEL